MKNALILFSILFFVSQSSISQNSLNDYPYVLIPQQFDFQKGKDQFQINTLLRHLFNKSGFNAIYDEELKGLPRCNGLFADLDVDSNFLNTTIQILLKDCNNNIVYRSSPGRSKEKEYKKSYHEAIRMAFESIEMMGVNQGDLASFRENIDKRDSAFSIAQTVVENTPLISQDEINLKGLVAYDFKGDRYYLEASNKDFVMYKKGNNNQDFEKHGVLVETSRPGIYLFNKDGNSRLANFDEQGNLLIDGVDSQGNPIQNAFRKVKEE